MQKRLIAPAWGIFSACAPIALTSRENRTAGVRGGRPAPVSCVLQPGLAGLVFGFKTGDFVDLLHGQADIVEAIEQAMFAEWVDIEAEIFIAGGPFDGLVGQIDREGAPVGFGRFLHQNIDLFLRQFDRQDAVFEAVIVEDVGE